MEKSAMSHASKNSGASAAKNIISALNFDRRVRVQLNIQAS